MPVRLDACTVVELKRFAITTAAVSLVALICLAPSLAAASPRSHTPPRKCGKPPRGHHHGRPFHAATIYEVAGGTVRSGSKVRLQAVVSAVAISGRRAWLGVAPDDPAYSGWEYSGLEIHLPRHPHVSQIEVGDRVTVLGKVSADPAGNRLGVLTLKVESSGATVEPLDVADMELLSPADPRALDAVLVRVPNLSIATASPTETTMTDGLTLGNAIIGELPVPFSLPFEFKAVTGIADTLGAGPRLLPRAFADFDLGT